MGYVVWVFSLVVGLYVVHFAFEFNMARILAYSDLSPAHASKPTIARASDSVVARLQVAFTMCWVVWLGYLIAESASYPWIAEKIRYVLILPAVCFVFIWWTGIGHVKRITGIAR